MVNFTTVLIAGMIAGHGVFSNDPIGRNTGGFSVDQRGKLVMVDTDSWPDEVGFNEAREVLTVFLDANGNSTAQLDGRRMESSGKVQLKKHAGIGNHVAGDIHYTLVVADNGPGFTYWFTDLKYQPYRNDRYGKRIKATAAPIPLERKVSKLNEPIWQKQKVYAYESIGEFAEQLFAQLESIGKPTVVNIEM